MNHVTNETRSVVDALVLEVFRLNSLLLSAGDELVAEIGLTGTRWQVLGAIRRSQVAIPVAHLARNMGLARQSVQRQIDDMLKDGLIRLEDNPHHRRASLVVMTERGAQAYANAGLLHQNWSRRLAAGFDAAEFENARQCLRQLQDRLQQMAETANCD